MGERVKEPVKIALLRKGGMVQPVLNASFGPVVIDHDADGAKGTISVPQENGTTAQAPPLSSSFGWTAGDFGLAVHESFNETDKAALEDEEPA